jgi:hypothetical protein
MQCPNALNTEFVSKIKNDENSSSALLKPTGAWEKGQKNNPLILLSLHPPPTPL